MRKVYFVMISLVSVVLIGLLINIGSFRSRIFSYLKQERAALQETAELRLLDFHIPDFKALIYHNYSQDSTLSMGPYVRYYQMIVELFPQLSETNALLGYCYYYANEPTKALKAFSKAIQEKPDFYWSYYNAGVIYYNNKQYSKAAAILSKANALDVMKTMIILSQSKPYLDFLSSEKQMNIFMENIERARMKSVLIVALSLKHMGKDKEAKRFFDKFKDKIPAEIEKEKFPLVLF